MKFEILNLFSFILGIVAVDNFHFYYIFSILPLFFLPNINKKLIIFFLLFFTLGYCITDIYKKNKISKKIELSQNYFLEGQILNIKEKKFERELVIKIKKIYTGNEYINSKEKILLLTKNNNKFLVGEILRIKEFSIDEIHPPKNPLEFNYRKFMERQGIYYIIKTDNIEIIKSEKNFKILYSLLREKIEKRIENYMKFNPDGWELTKLITIGSDDPPDFLKEVGIKSGIYHLFVISGIHIMFLVLFFKILFIPFQKINNIHPKLFPSLLLIILWFYDFLCGFKIPVTRAVLMASFYLIFEIIDRKIEPIKSLIFACFLFLFINPYNIYSTSFLLSFLSTSGILLIFKKINFKKNFILTSFISTISAQLFILPILFYNFGFFYPVGILNNLIFTPFVGFLTINSFIAIIIPFFFSLLNFATNIFLKFLIFISNVSFKINIYFPVFFVFVYYFFLLIFFLSIPKKLKFFISFLIISFLMFQGNFKKDKKEEIIFFSLKNPFILIHKEGRSILITSDKIEKPFFYKSTLYKIFKKRKFKIEKVILIGNKFPENFIFISKYCKKIYLPNYTITPYVNSYKNIKKYNQENDEIILDNFVFSFKNGNLIIKYNDFKFLIILNENFEESLVKDKYFFIYPIVFKKNKKNEVIINGLKPYFYILQKDIKKFENLKGLCQNYFLNISSVILDLETGLIDYWRENDKGKY